MVKEKGEAKATRGSVDFSFSLTYVHGICQRTKLITMSTIEFCTRFDQMTPVLNTFAYNLTKNSEDAKDLYQETAFRAITNKEKFRVGTNFKAWLFTIRVFRG